MTICLTVEVSARFLQCNGGKLEEAEGFKGLFVYCKTCLNQNRSALERDLLSKNSLFVVQLYADKSLALFACDLITFTSDPQSLVELIYFLKSYFSNC